MIADGFAVVVSWMQSYLPGQPVHTISQNQPPLNPSSNPTQTEDFLAV